MRVNAPHVSVFFSKCLEIPQGIARRFQCHEFIVPHDSDVFISLYGFSVMSMYAANVSAPAMTSAMMQATLTTVSQSV